MTTSSTRRTSSRVRTADSSAGTSNVPNGSRIPGSTPVTSVTHSPSATTSPTGRPIPSRVPATYRVSRGGRGPTGTTETPEVAPGTCWPVRTAVRPGRTSNARSGSRTRGCTPVRSVTRRSSVVTTTTVSPASNPDAVTSRASPGRSHRSSTPAPTAVSARGTDSTPIRPDSPSVTGAESVTHEPLPFQRMIDPKLSIRERTTSSDRAAIFEQRGNPTSTGPQHGYVSPSHVHYRCHTSAMPAARPSPR